MAVVQPRTSPIPYCTESDAGTTVRLDYMDNVHFGYWVTLSGFLSPA